MERFSVLKRSFSFFAVLFLLSSNTLSSKSAEGDLFTYLGVCEIELADGTRETIECPETQPSVLNAEEILRSIRDFREADQSLANQELRQLSERGTAAPGIGLDHPRIIESADKLAKFYDAGDYVVTIRYRNDQSFPLKSSDDRGYFSINDDKLFIYGNDFEQQWDSIILSQLVGSEHKAYRSTVEAVSNDEVTIKVRLKSTELLPQILEGQLGVTYIEHLGSPETPFEEVTR